MATFKGGEKTTRLLNALLERMSPPAFLKVGFLEKATYPDGTPVAMIGAIQNYGAPAVGIPPRPFFTNMVAEKRDGWPRALAVNLKAQNYDGKRALALMGEGIAGQLRQSIVDTNEPALKPATIVAKGGTRGMVYNPRDPATYPAKPLVDTGHMLGSVDYEVK